MVTWPIPPLKVNLFHCSTFPPRRNIYFKKLTIYLPYILKLLLWCSSDVKIESDQKLSARLHLGAHYIFLVLLDRGRRF